MALSLVDVSWTARSGRSRLDVPIPAAAIEDDYLIFRCEGTVTTNDSTSFGSSIDSDTLNVAVGTRYATLLAVKLTASDASASTKRVYFTSSGNISVACEIWRGQDLTTPIDVTPTSSHVVTGNDPASITTVTDASAVLAILFGDDSDPGTTAVPSGYTESQLIETSGNITPPHTHGSAYKIVSTAGAENPGAWTGSSSNDVSMTIALRDANPPAGGVEGTVAVTEGSDTLSSDGSLEITGDLTQTEGADTSSAAGQLTIRGSTSETEGADTLSSTAITNEINATVAVTEGADTLSSTGTISNTGNAAITETGDSLASAGEHTLRGSVSSTESGDTLNSDAELTLRGSVGSTETGDTLTATGSVTITGAVGATETGDTLSSTGSVAGGVVADVDVTEQGDTLSSEASITNRGILASTEQPDTLASTGVHPASEGAVDSTENRDTVSSTGVHPGAILADRGDYPFPMRKGRNKLIYDPSAKWEDLVKTEQSKRLEEQVTRTEKAAKRYIARQKPADEKKLKAEIIKTREIVRGLETKPVFEQQINVSDTEEPIIDAEFNMKFIEELLAYIDYQREIRQTKERRKMQAIVELLL